MSTYAVPASDLTVRRHTAQMALPVRRPTAATYRRRRLVQAASHEPLLLLLLLLLLLAVIGCLPPTSVSYTHLTLPTKRIV